MLCSTIRSNFKVEVIKYIGQCMLGGHGRHQPLFLKWPSMPMPCPRYAKHPIRFDIQQNFGEIKFTEITCKL